MDSFDDLAMGNFPFSSSYISGDPLHPMPPFPMRIACGYLAALKATLSDLAYAVGVINNASGNVMCYANVTQPATDTVSMTYNLQVCTEILPQSDFFPAKGLPNDMFYAQPAWNKTRLDKFCQGVYNATPRTGWIPLLYGLDRIKASSNIVFSNGEYDPWRTGGITTDVGSDTIVPVYIAEGAHHLDLFFSDPGDPPSVVAARAVELSWIDRWIRKEV